MIQEYHTTSENSINNFVTLSEKPWKSKKEQAVKVSRAYNRIGYTTRSQLVNDCGTFLEFAKYSNNDIKLHNANFCRVRMCPMCAWRRSLKLGHQVSRVLDEALKDKTNKLLFLTLTVKNVPACDLSKTITEMFDGYHRMFKTAKVRKAVKGAFRALEVTYNRNRDDYHPHLHIILLVDRHYGCYEDTSYISQKEWSSIWQNVLKIDYMPIVDVRKVRPNNRSFDTTTGIAAEGTKGETLLHENLALSDYVAKGIIDDSTPLPNVLFDKVLKTLDDSLSHRQMVSFRGELLKIYKELELDDIDDGDLINTDDQDIRPELEYILLRYRWMMGDYVLLNDENEPASEEPSVHGAHVIDGDKGLEGETFYCVQYVDDDGVFDTVAYYDTYSDLSQDFGCLANEYDIQRLLVYFHTDDGYQDITDNFL